MIKAGIVGGAGYTAGELIRILIHHPEVHLDFIYSTSNAGNPVASVHRDLIGDTDLKFTHEVHPDIDVLFLCLGHGNSTRFLADNNFGPQVKIIDLSHDYRLKEQATYKEGEFVYGLPELRKEAIASAKYVANPGCFATGIQLALLPLAKKQALHHEVHVHAITGSTGAGVSLSETTHFSWRNNNVSVYKAFTHQHLGEINESLNSLQESWNKDINFIPVRGDFPRGILATVYTDCDLSEKDARGLYQDFYADAPFTHMSDSPVYLKQVVNTNKCVLHVEKYGNKLLICSIVDNLLKGASGQAVQNMNLMFGLPETTGLHIKALAF